MKTCSTCKYWTPIDTDSTNDKQYGKCPVVSELLCLNDANGFLIDIPETYEDMGCPLHNEK